MSFTIAAAESPDPETIRRFAREVVSRPDYQLEPAEDYRTPVIAWILDFLWWLSTPLRALFKALHEISPPLAWVVVVLLVVVLLLLLTHIAWTFRQALQRRSFGRVGEERQAREVDPAELERQAVAAGAAGDYITAVRLLFRACLLWLQRAERRPLRRGITNREVLRRYHGRPAFEPLRIFVETIDRKWYGRGACDAADYERCAQAHDRIRRVARGDGHADVP